MAPIAGAQPRPFESVLVVGAGQAAVQFADRLRQGGHRGPVTLVGEEPHLPYQRPPLSKAWLRGEATAADLMLRAPDHYDDHGIELVTDAVVERLVRDGDGVVGTWRSRSMGTHSRRFDRLVLATGARPRRLTLPGAEHPDVLELRGIDDAGRLAERLPARVVVIGGGFIGLEVAATARDLGAEVTVVEAGDRLMGRAVDASTADFLTRAHRGTGIEILLGAVPERVEADAAGLRAVVLADGRVLPAETVVVGVGVTPRTELAEQLGLECAGGIRVDEQCVASDGRTLAIGDCTIQRVDGEWLRLESVDNAVEQAGLAADAVTGAAPSTRPAPWFWSDQGGWKLQIVGRSAGHREVVVREDPDKPRRRVALYFGDNGFLGAECVNAPADFVALRTALARGARPTPEAVADPAVPLRKALAGPQLSC